MGGKRNPPEECGSSRPPQEQLLCPTQPNSLWPKRASPRRYYSEDTRVAPVCFGRQWNQVERNEMVLNMGKGIYEPVTRPAQPPQQAPPLSSPTPGSPAPPPARGSLGRPVPASHSWVAAAPQHQAARRTHPWGLRHSGEWRRLRTERLGEALGGCYGISG